MQWPDSWETIMPGEQQTLEVELKREVVPGHPLYDVDVKAIARRADCDDVLFEVSGSSCVAMVHLSYSKEADSLWPHTQIFGSLSEWKRGK